MYFNNIVLFNTMVKHFLIKFLRLIKKKPNNQFITNVDKTNSN